MKRIICKDCGKTIYRCANAMFCFGCIEKHEREGGRLRYARNRGKIGQECIFCGRELEQIHHADLDTENNISKNLVPLCMKCHKKIHYLIIKPILRKVEQK